MIEINNLVKRYGDKAAVGGISFTVGDGEIVGLLGPNGAGKSTTMNIVTGYTSATEGNIVIDGHDILDEPQAAKKLIGFLPESPPLYQDMTVEEYLNFVYELKNCTLNRKRHLEEIAEVTKISDVYKRIIRNLSKGYKQRVGIAQALIGNPKVIIFDEPTVGLDPKQIIEVRNLIRMLGRDHTVILSTHILSEVQAVCDRIVIINKGKIVADERTEDLSRVVDGKRRYMFKICGPQKEILEALKTVQGVTFVETMSEHELDSTSFLVESESGADIRKGIFTVLARNDWALIGVEAMGVNLEEIFISLVDKPGTAAGRRKRISKENSDKEVKG